MGPSVSVQKNITDIAKKEVTDMSVNILEDSMEVLDDTVTVDQKMTTNFADANIQCKSLKIRQGANIDKRVFSKMLDKNEKEFQRKLENIFPTIIDNIIRDEKSGINLSAFDFNSSNVKNVLNEELYNDLSTKIAKETRKKVNNTIDVNQDFDLNFAGATITPSLDKDGNPIGDCEVDISQNVDLKSVLTNTMESSDIVRTIDKVVNDLSTEVTTVQEKTTQGIFSGNNMVTIVFAVLGFLLLMFLLRMLLFGKKKTPKRRKY